MYLGISSTAQPINRLIVESRNTIINSASEKIVLDVFYDVFYFPFTLRITFATETHLEWSALTIRAKSLREDYIAFIFIHQQHFVLIINKLERIGVNECKSSFMCCNGCFSDKWMLIEKYKLEA